jgi:methionyl-tRNA formyltransferase
MRTALTQPHAFTICLPHLITRRPWGSRCFASAPIAHDPLHILFCGADDFSIYSLRALHKLSQERKEKIASIDVVCRPDKRVGRGLKHVQAVPIKAVATELGLNLHQVDVMKDWDPPKPCDLIVTVSFGLFVPSRILGTARYGGLNVHPSLLPQFRGAAPIQHSLLSRQQRTGVTLQTMDSKKFDHGKLLSSVSHDIRPGSTPQDLIEQLGPLGADLLIQGINEGLFLDTGAHQQVSQCEQASYAPKITPEDRHVDWSSWTSDEILLRDWVLGRLWDTTTHSLCHGIACDSSDGFDHKTKRVTFHGPWKQHLGEPGEKAGRPVLAEADGERMLGLVAADDVTVIPTEITIENESRKGGMRKLVHALEKTLSSRSV